MRPIIGLCDRCSVPVRNYGTVSISPDTGRHLTLCGHHTNVHRVRLVELGWIILEPTLVDLDEIQPPFPWLPPPRDISRHAEDCDTPDDETRT